MDQLTSGGFTSSYGGRRIVSWPTDKSFCYEDGQNLMVVNEDRLSSLAEFQAKLSCFLLNNGAPFTLKYQLPNEEGLDSLISVNSDDDLENMYQLVDRTASNPSSLIRLFLFPTKPTSSVMSLRILPLIIRVRSDDYSNLDDQFQQINLSAAPQNQPPPSNPSQLIRTPSVESLVSDSYDEYSVISDSSDESQISDSRRIHRFQQSYYRHRQRSLQRILGHQKPHSMRCHRQQVGARRRESRAQPRSSR